MTARMRMSRAGMAMLLADEGIVLKAYRCAADEWTIGAGHTSKAGPPKPVAGMTITLPEAIALFIQDIEAFETGVLKAVKRPLKQHEFDALVSFHFNTGAISTGSIDEKLNAGNDVAAMATLAQYCKANGKVLAGLRDRRAREIALFENGAYLDRPILLTGEAGKSRSIRAADIPWPVSPAAPPPAPLPPPPVAEPAPATPPQPAGFLALIISILSALIGERK